MYDFFLSEAGKKAKQDAIDLVNSVDRQYILDMDADKITFPKEFLKEAGRRNLLGVKCKPENGGRGLSWVDYQAVIEEIGTLGYIFSCTFGVGPDLITYALENHATEELQKRYIVPTLKGERFGAECLTEPRGGSDFFGATSTAEDMGDYYLLNGQKRFIVGGDGADYFFVYARTNLDPNAHPHNCISAFMVDKVEGVEVSYIYGLMGCRGGGAARVTFKDVKVPKENIVGTLNGGYDVFNTMMIPERLGTAMMTVGTAKAALDVATRYTTRRKQFGKVIKRYQGVSFQVAQAASLLDASRSLCHMACVAVDTKQDLDTIRRLISETKKFTTESCQEAARLSMQVMGGIGYTNVYPVERYVRDLGLASIWTGTSEVMQMIVASEWYKLYNKNEKERSERDYEFDAEEALAADEKIYE